MFWSFSEESIKATSRSLFSSDLGCVYIVPTEAICSAIYLESIKCTVSTLVLLISILFICQLFRKRIKTSDEIRRIHSFESLLCDEYILVLNHYVGHWEHKEDKERCEILDLALDQNNLWTRNVWDVTQQFGSAGWECWDVFGLSFFNLFSLFQGS